MDMDEPSMPEGPDARLDRLTAHNPGLCARPAGRYATFSRVGALLFSSGVVGREHGQVLTGQLMGDACRQRGERAAVAAVLAILRAAQAELGSLAHVVKTVNLMGYIHAGEGFIPLREVMDAASAALQQVFPDAALPARTCVAVAGLPGGGIAEIALVLQITDGLAIDSVALGPG